MDLETSKIPCWFMTAFETEAVEIACLKLILIALQSGEQSRHGSISLTRYAQ
jgi:hypothetical protein